GRPREHDLRLVEEHDESTATDGIRIDPQRSAEEVAARLAARMRYLRCPSRRGGGVVAYRRQLPVGYGAWRYGTDGDTVFLHAASTLRPHRRTGVYTAILEYRLARAARDAQGRKEERRGHERAVAAGQLGEAPDALDRWTGVDVDARLIVGIAPGARITRAQGGLPSVEQPLEEDPELAVDGLERGAELFGDGRGEIVGERTEVGDRAVEVRALFGQEPVALADLGELGGRERGHRLDRAEPATGARTYPCRVR